MSNRDKTVDASSTQSMKREFTAGSVMSMAFVFISPIVAIYSVFGFGLEMVGPGFWWGWVIVFIGQIFVALTLGVLASRWTDAGGVYQWSRRLLGERYGWFAGWAYISALLIALTSVSFIAAIFVADLFELDSGNVGLVTFIAIILLVLITLLGMAGRWIIKVLAYATLVAEIIASIGVAIYLLVFHRNNDLSILFEGLDAPVSGNAILGAPIVIALIFAGWSALGFESASTLAEEVKNPKKAVPMAMLWSIVLIAGTVLFTGLAFILAIPSSDFLASEEAAADPVLAILTYYFPAEAVKVILAMFIIAFLACLMAVHTSVSRVIWVYGRDRKLPFGKTLGNLRGKHSLPVAAMVVAGVIPMLLFIPFQSDDIFNILIEFTVIGFFLAFTFPVLGFVVARLTGRWKAPEGERLFLGKWGAPISWIALVWLVLATTNVMWPRDREMDPIADWYAVLAVILIFVVGAIVMVVMNARNGKAGNEAVSDSADVSHH